LRERFELEARAILTRSRSIEESTPAFQRPNDRLLTDFERSLAQPRGRTFVSKREKGKESDVSSNIARILVAVLVVAGLTLAGYGARRAYLGNASKNWPQTEGSVVESEVTKERVERSRSDSGRPRYETRYRPRVRYFYTVEGQTYSSERVGFGSESMRDRKVADAIVQQYPAGSLPIVYFSPDDPGSAVLEPGLTLGGILPLLVGSVLAVFSLVFMRVFFPAKPAAARAAVDRAALAQHPSQ
jgi:hypothetical protein